MGELKHYLPAREFGPDLPLERYLDPLPADVVGRYLDCCTEPGDLILDPVAQRPVLPLVAAHLGRKAVVSNFNPINTLVIEGTLTLPDPSQIDAATTQLGDSPKRGVPLRDHINRLYASTCGHCSNPVIVACFLWDAEVDTPVQKQYECPHCGGSGEFPMEGEDFQALDGVEDQGVHYWYLLERLTQPHDPERQLVQELLQLYTPRNLYALVNISMKIETLFADSPLQTTLQLILLSCLDSCSKLAGAPLPRASALRLPAPQRFVERNVWRAFEEAYQAVRQMAPSPPLNLANSAEGLMEQNTGSLVLNEPVRSVAAELPPDSVSLIIGSPQDYYRPFWTLSYLWSGWLWGRRKAAPLRPLLRRKTMGWTWYRRTLSAALQSLHRPLRREGRMVFLLEDAGLAHVSNLILAAMGASFTIEGILYQPSDTDPPRHPKQSVSGAYRLAFSMKGAAYPEPAQPSSEALGADLRRTALQAITELLRERGQALHISWLHAAAWEAWAREGLLRQALALDKALSAADFLQEELEAALDEGLEAGLLELVPLEPDGESVPQFWWIRGHAYPSHPLGEQVEEALIQELSPIGLFREQIEDSIYARFPGLLTPEAPLLDRCLESYATCDAASGAWLPRSEDRPENLSRERHVALATLATLGHRLGYQVTSLANGSLNRGGRLPQAIDVSWYGRGTKPQLFAVKQTTGFGDLLSQASEDKEETQSYLVIPERRVDLICFRMETEALLSKALAEGRWRFLKLNNLRALAAREELDPKDLELMVGLEPLDGSPDAQLPLFS